MKAEVERASRGDQEDVDQVGRRITQERAM